MIYDYFRVTGAHDIVSDYADLFSITLRDDNVQEFDTRSDEVLLSMTKIPSDEILESLYKLKIRESVHLKTVLEVYDLDVHQKISVPNNQKLKTMVKRSIDQKLRLRNFDARHGKIESGAVGKSRKGAIGVEGGKGSCHQWKEKGQCSQGDCCSFRHVTQDRAQNQNTLPPHLPSQPFHEVEVCLGREASEAKVTWIHCSSTVRTCMRTPCDFWHPPECHFFLNTNGLLGGRDAFVSSLQNI